jgi:uncharacterized protein with HEPN domain
VTRLLAELLADASYYARRAGTYVEDIDFVEFAANAMRREAVCFCLIVVGEACDRILKELQSAPPEVPWSDIKAMRNVLVHEYWQIDDLIVYNVARNDAPLLADTVDDFAKHLER